MMTGRQVLSSVDQALNEAHSNVNRVDNQIEALNEQLLASHKARTEDYRELARIRLGVLAERGIVQHIDDVERQVGALLEQRGQALESLNTHIQKSMHAIKELESERQQQAEKHEAVALAVDIAEAGTQKKLDLDTDYRQQREKTEAAERKALHAREKAARSDEERRVKGSSYQNDILFMYLWNRKYSLPAYHANLLTRWLDSIVARHIGYTDARANYSRLGEIPKRLQEHADAVEIAAQEQFEALKKLDTLARDADGIPALEQRMTTEQDALDSIDESLMQSSMDMQTLNGKRAEFSEGKDEYSRRAIDYMATEYQRNDLMELRRDALTTPFPDDDLVVSRLLDREGRSRELEASMQGLRELIERNQTQLNELEALRADFKRGRFDRPGSTFGDKAVIAMMLGQLLNGMVGRKTVWKVLQEQQRYRPQQSDPTFGSGRYGRGSVWNGGLGRLERDLGSVFGGGLGGGLGRSGNWGSGGGFRTGGGF